MADSVVKAEEAPLYLRGKMDLRARKDPVRRSPKHAQILYILRFRVYFLNEARRWWRGVLPRAECAWASVWTIAPPNEWPPRNIAPLLLVACSSALMASATAMSMPEEERASTKVRL